MACLRQGDAILVGHAFDRSGTSLDSLPAELAVLENATDLPALLRGMWGNYALFFASPGTAFVYREPSGSDPVYRCGGDDETIFVSDAEFGSQLGVVGQPRIDTRFLVHWLQFPFLRTRRTGLQDVHELLPGMLASRTGAGQWTESSVWHPSSFATRARSIDDPLEAAERLRDTALQVVGAQAPESRLILRLSGGLDSSIIAACLANAGAKVPCINFATRTRDGDERDYARDVAATFGLELVEVGEPERVELKVPQVRSFRPLINPLLEPFERALAAAANELGAALLVDGGGGDNLFCSITSAAPAIDALAAGSLRSARTAIADIASRADCTMWDVLVAAVRKLSRRRTSWKEDRSFLEAGVLLRRCEQHPWLQNLVVPPGKREHVEALVHVHHFLDRAASSISLLHPLLAQPLLELCLRIPSWLWVRGGRDRAVARDAFAGLVPSSVLKRRMKGSLQSLLYRSFKELRLEMQELLLDGELAKDGIIDTEAVHLVLTGEDWMTDSVQLRISEMVALELWLRSWRSAASSPSGP
jgi:asparagine synthase (glutamine-hydrolysing)